MKNPLYSLRHDPFCTLFETVSFLPLTGEGSCVMLKPTYPIGEWIFSAYRAAVLHPYNPTGNPIEKGFLGFLNLSKGFIHHNF